MISVRRIILVNWYAFAAIEIEIRGDAAFVGDNGAGKSSILDAIQLALTGNDGRYFQPNARAEEGGRSKQGRRSVRDYCLGKITGLEGEEPLREGGASYVVLVASDPDGARRLNFGVALYADKVSAAAEVEGLFVLPGPALRAADFHVGGADDAAAAPWQETRQRLERLASDAGETVRTFDRPGDYIRSLLQHVRGRGGQANPDHWLRAMKMAASFRGVDSPNEFVRDYILPERPIDLPELRADIRRYRELVARIHRLEDQERDLSLVGTAFTEHFATLSRSRVAAALAASCRRVMAERRVERGELEVETSTRERARLESAVGREKEELEKCRSDLAEAKASLDGDPARVRLLQAKLEHQEAVAALRDAAADLRHARERFSAILDALSLARAVGVEDTGLAASFTAAFGPDAGEGWPQDPGAVAGALACAPGLGGVAKRLDVLKVACQERWAKAREDARVAIDQLADAEAGGFRLRRETKNLLEALRAEGMEPIPVCAVAKVSDPEWARAAETLLGAGREAILVERDEVQPAIRRIRRERDRFYGCTIVQVSGMERFGGRPDAGSLAGVVETDDPRARAFINQRLGGIARVRSEAELASSSRAVTSDCQYASGGGVQNRRPEAELILGRRWDASDVARLTLARDAAVSASREAEARLDRVSSAAYALDRAAAGLGGLVDIQELAAGRDRADAAVGRTAGMMLAAERSVPEELSRRVRDLEEEVRERLEEIAADENSLKLEHGKLGSATAELKVAREELARREEQLAQLPADLQERQSAIEHLEVWLGGRHGLTALLEDAEARARRGEQETERQRISADNRLADYWHRYADRPESLTGASMETLGGTEGKARWVGQRLERLRLHELRPHKENAVMAESRVSQGLRQDLFLKLASRVEEGRRLLSDLNRHLRHRQFHGEIYAFRQEPKVEFDDVLKASEAVRKDAALADDATSPSSDETVDRGRRRVLALLEEEGPAADAEVARLADYRVYFTYDVEMRSAQSGAVVGRLSQRLRTGSGGEREAPSYAAVGTALAAANNIEPGAPSEHTGMALALFDEAFTRLDDANIGSVLDVMRQLGLQLLVAAPSSKWFAFASRFETVVNVVRIERVVQLTVQHMDEGVRARMRADNPYEMTLDEWSARADRRQAAE